MSGRWKKPNHCWDPLGQCFRYPISGDISVTVEEMYSNPKAMRYWCAVGFICAMAWLGLGDGRYYTVQKNYW